MDLLLAIHATIRRGLAAIVPIVAQAVEPHGLIPTGENIARVIAHRMQVALGAAVRVTQVVVAEDPTLSSTWSVGPG